MRRALAAVAVATLALAGCASSSEGPSAKESPTAGSSAGSPSESPSPDAPSTSPSAADDSADAIEIEIEGDRVTPSGERVDAKVGEPITLHVKSDRAAELHVHSSPEQELAVKAGESTLTIKINTPGIVEVEEHHSETVVLQLEVR